MTKKVIIMNASNWAHENVRVKTMDETGKKYTCTLQSGEYVELGESVYESVELVDLNPDKVGIEQLHDPDIPGKTICPDVEIKFGGLERLVQQKWLAR